MNISFSCLFDLPVDGTCCYAMTAVCLACNQGESVAEYCGANPSTVGCPPYVTFRYQYHNVLHRIILLDNTI